MNTDPAATPPSHTDQPNWGAFTRVAAIAAIAGWALFVVAAVANLGAAEEGAAKAAAKSRIMVGYLSGFTYWASLPLGAMALLMMRYVCKTSWGLLLTRPFEAATRTLPLLFVLWLPLVASVAFKESETHKDSVTHEEHVVQQAPFSPYWWSHSHHEEAPKPNTDPNAQEHPGDKREQTVKTGLLAMQKRIDERHEEEEKEIAAGQYGFLSVPGYIGTGIVLFAIWGVMIIFLLKWGRETSEATDPAVVDRGLEKLQNISGPGLIVYAITTTASATQWVMSLEPGWSSTMFPVIFAVNQFLTCFALCLALFLLVAGRPPFAGHMRPKFQLDMATLMLVFTLFWSYTSFSQFMLVWIGNLPEEIPFFLKRSNYGGEKSGWWYVSAALIALHFALPFLLLLFRNIKLHPVRLRIVAVYLCLICAVDVIWWVAPSAQSHGFPAWLIDVGAVLGVGGVWGLFFIYHLRKRPLFPDNQAFLLPEGHHHGHH